VAEFRDLQNKQRCYERLSICPWSALKTWNEETQFGDEGTGIVSLFIFFILQSGS